MENMYKPDKIDKKLLHELDINARLPISKLAKKLRVSRDVVNYRINKLQKEDIIKGFRAFVDSSRLGYKIYRIYFKFYSINKANLDLLIKTLQNNDKVFWVSETDGFVDFVFGIWFKEEQEFQDFYTKLMSQFRQFIKQDYIHRVIHYLYLDRAYLLNKNTQKRIHFKLGGEKREKYDKTEEKIIKILSDNARTSIIEIAQKVKLDSATIIYRIRQLEKKGIILGYRTDLNLNLLNREFYSVKLYLSDFKNKKQILSYLQTTPYVVNLVEAIGSWDIEFDLEVSSSKEYHDLINKLKGKYEEISEIQFFRAPNIIKFVNTPI